MATSMEKVGTGVLAVLSPHSNRMTYIFWWIITQLIQSGHLC